MNQRLLISVCAFVVWTVITVVGGRIRTEGVSSLTEGVTNGIGWQFVAASMFILVVVQWQRWGDVGLCKPKSWQSLWLLWLPMLYIVLGLVLAFLLHLPPTGVLVYVLINTLFVGFSEELMFRGVLLQAFRRSVSIWPAVVLTSILFGAIHSLNVFTTGNLQLALIQSAAALLSGVIFIALRLRLGSLWPCILLHALWDFAVFTISATATSESNGSESLTGIRMFFPILLVLPNAIYGIWLMRNIGKTHANPDM